MFDNIDIDLNGLVCHSGGADGSDTYFNKIGKIYGVRTIDYTYKTKYHNSDDAFEISDDDYHEGIIEVNKANKILNRFGIHKYMNLLSRNWAQVKYSDVIYAIGVIIEPGDKSKKGYYNKSKYDVVDGGTGYAVQMGINNNKDVYVFDQNIGIWYRWSYTSLRFVELKKDIKILSNNFAGIGTREINEIGIKAIEELYKNTFK